MQHLISTLKACIPDSANVNAVSAISWCHLIIGWISVILGLTAILLLISTGPCGMEIIEQYAF